MSLANLSLGTSTALCHKSYCYFKNNQRIINLTRQIFSIDENDQHRISNSEILLSMLKLVATGKGECDGKMNLKLVLLDIFGSRKILNKI